MRIVLLTTVLVLAALTGCDGEPPAADLTYKPMPASAIDDPAPVAIVPGRTVYVPAYTGVRHYDEGRIYPLAVTLSVRNVDAERGIVLEVVDLRDSEGRLVNRYLTESVRLAPLATAEFFVPERDEPADSGVSFLVTWSAAGPVHPPVVESVMIGTSGTQGISFTAAGIPYGERAAP
jgi:hypothetical protein